jgi:hypothetical protein
MTDMLLSIEAQLQCWLNPSYTLSKPDKCFLICTTNAPDRDLVTVFKERPFLSAIQCERLLAILALLEEASILSSCLSTDGTRSEQVSWVEGTAIDGVMCQHLWERPHQIPCVHFRYGRGIAR